jgi:hypothetical protein
MDTEQQRGAGLSFRLDPEAKALIATVAPDPAAQPIDETWLIGRLAELGFGGLRYLPAAGMLLLAKYNTGGTVTVKLAEQVDAGMHISVSPDGLAALLHLSAAQGGVGATRDAVRAALREMNIEQGILDDAIDAAVAAGSAQGVTIALGRAPINGSDGRFESLVPEVRSRVPRVDESGHTDYRDMGEILVVHPGDKLMLRHPATAGSAGLTLFGETIPPKPGKDTMYSANLAGTTFAPDNPDLLVAAISGQPVVVKGGMIVEPLYKVDEVGIASGNIDFDGSVVIRGEVSAGMTVRATGDIEVGGVVESATLEAGGSIVIKGGAIGSPGRKSSGEHYIRCGGCFTAAFAQQSSIEAGDSIFIDDVAMQCELTAHNHIRVGNQKRGHIIGGKAQATLSITGRVIGSPNRVATRLEIGVNPSFHKQLLELAKDRDGKENQLLEISKLLDFASKNPGKVRPEMIEKARTTAGVLGEAIAAMREEQEGLTKKIELSQQSRVIAEQAIHEGAEVVMGNQRYRVVGEQGACAIGLTENGLAQMPLEDKA